MNQKPNVLFLCTGNSCRSQMAEGWAKKLKGEQANFYSAGVETHGLNPFAIRVMAEGGVDISEHQSQHVSEFEDIDFDWVFAVCDHARQCCAELQGKGKHVAACFDDPPALARQLPEGEDVLPVYRQVRDQIRDYIAQLEFGA